MLLDMDGRYKYLYLVSFMCLNYQLYGPVMSEVVTQVNASQSAWDLFQDLSFLVYSGKINLLVSRRSTCC